MDNEKLISKIFFEIQKDPSIVRAYRDMLTVCRDIEQTDFRLAHNSNKRMRNLISKGMQAGAYKELFEIYKKSLLFDAPHDFDSYLLYLEINRKPSERFYQPRRRVLKQVVDNLQKLVDDELDELFLSEPPRIGKTSMLMFFVTWILGRNSESSNLYSAYSDTITKAFYNGVMEIITDPVTYLWKDVFPNSDIVQTNSADEILNLDRKKRYPSLTCRSLYGTLNGACDCNGFLISDDLIGGIEEALNKDRMLSAWSKVDNNLLTRAKEKAKILWCGTRWSMIDPAGLRMDLLENDEEFKNRRYEIINLPALNGNDESNFDYDYGVGFDTNYYHQRRASFERNNDMASWQAQYMGEPIERDGALFSPEDMRYFNGDLPDNSPDTVFMCVDPAFGGGDFVAAPVCYQYGSDVFIPDVVYDNRDKSVTIPLLVDMAIKHGVKCMEIEANKSLQSYADEVRRAFKAKEYHITILTKPASTATSKVNRIFERAPDIREHMVFLDSGKRSKPYSQFMQNVFAFTIVGNKNKHDDAPDSLTMSISRVLSFVRKVEVFRRKF